jgi:capsular exopolysaccharide synthesis family protein
MVCKEAHGMSPKTSIATAASGAPEAIAAFQKLKSLQRSRMLVGPEMDHVVVEQYRRMGAILHYMQTQSGTRSFMVASAVPHEGKTLTTVNLALTLSESFKRRVVIVDADLRRPTVHEVLQLPNVNGLNDGLKNGGTAWKPAVIEVTPHLSVLTAGRPNPDPISALTSPRMRQLIDELGTRYDWVILDTPPVGLMPDAHLLAGMVGGAVLVIASGCAPYRMVHRAVESLGRDNIIGVVLNRAKSPGIVDSYGYGGYGRYGDSPE